MFWEKKEKGAGLPDLPRPRPISPPAMMDRSTIKDEFDEDEDVEDVHELPAFPDSPMHKGFSQSAIKDAVSNEDVKEESHESWKTEPKPTYKLREIEEWTPVQPIQRMPSPPQNMRRDTKPIFVRIDKFQLARSSLETVKAKLSDIELLLKTIREVKAKEDSELSAWESEMDNVKSRVQNVINDIFEKSES